MGSPLAPGEDATARTVEVMSLLNQRVLADEVRYRTVLRLYLDLWLTGAASGDDRAGRARRSPCSVAQRIAGVGPRGCR